MRHAKEEPTWSSEQAIDFTSAVQQFHGLDSKELKRLLRVSDNLTLRGYTDEGSVIRVDMEKFASSLPLHLIAVLVSPSSDEFRLQYLLSGFRFLHSLSDLASRHIKFEQILFEELKVTEQILDLVFYVVIVLARYKQEKSVSSFLPLLHSALVACSFHLLTGYISSQWSDLALVLLAHSKVDVFVDAAFTAVCIDINFLQIKLSSLNNIVCNNTIPLSVEKAVHNLCQQIEASLQFLQSLCQQKLFRERLLKNKELCKNGGILSLARAILKLDILQFKDSSKIASSVSRLKSKVLSILLQLCETESISYLDEVASSPSSMQLAKSVTLEVLELLKTGFGKKQQLNDYFEISGPSGFVLLNSMRLADVFSDDSNFRYFITTNITHVLAEMLSLPHEEFLSSWCSTAVPLMEEDAFIGYDPFMAAGVVLASLSTGPETSEPSSETNTECSLNPNRLSPDSYAQQRTSLLVKIIANLQCFVPDICEEQERDLFFNKFLECLQMKLPSNGFSLTSDAQKATIVCKNLGSLLDFATSLIPSYLNEDDVNLVSEIFKQLQSRITQQFEGYSVQEQVQENKFKDARVWDKFSNATIGEHHQESQSTLGHGSPTSRKTGSNLLGVTPEARKFEDFKEGTSESLLYQDEETSKKKAKTEITRSASESLREISKVVQNFDTSGSDASSTGEKNSLDDDFPKLARVKERAFRRVEENEKGETTNGEEKQRRKRKRNIMNDKQVAIIERALLEEPDMHRNATSLQIWADKLSVHGSDLTASQLKNWLNNRKARLARAKGARGPSEGENTFQDKPSGSGQGHFYDSPESPSEEYYVPSTRRGSNQGSSKVGPTLRTGSGEMSEVAATDFVDFSEQSMQQMNSSSRYVQCEPGQHVLLLDDAAKEIGNAKVHQVEGRWHGKDLEEDRMCVADVFELKVEKWSRLQHPSEAAGTTFQEAEYKFGVMRVAWDSDKIVVFPR